ncbi:MAG: CHASE2 domain-containing protein, partial [Syntrophobacteraceae bacterium]|nr:CHASE2 domain-containing protein [Syntrophobacteraceae bacterium]
MRRRYFQAVVLGGGAAAVALVLWTAGFLDMWEFATWRWRVAFFARPGVATETIKLILLDQNSLAWGERENGWSWPWPREVYTPIIDYCVRNGAKAVIFDLLFTEPSLYGVEDDRSLAAAIDRAPAFIAPLFLGKTAGKSRVWPPDIPERLPLEIALLDEWLALRAPEELVMSMATFPVDDLAARSTILASVTQDPDFDGIFRRCRLFQIFDGRVIPSLSLAAYFAGTALDSQPPNPAQPGIPGAPETGSSAPYAMAIREGCLQVGERCVPMDDSGRTIIRYRGPVSTYETFSAAAVIQSELRIQQGEKPVIDRENVFRDCYVFLGTSAAGLLDLRPTPVSRIYPGVELHATILDNLISGDFLGAPPRWLTVVTTLLLALLSSLLVVTWRAAWRSALACGVLLPVPVLLGFFAYGMSSWWPVV